MKKLILATLLAAPLLASAVEPVNPDSTGFTFTDVKVIAHSPVRDQNKSGTCWCFAGTSFFENEILRKTGRNVDLSQMFTVRHCYDDKAQKYQRMGGTINFAQGGSVMDIPYVWQRYGAVPAEAYTGLQYGEEKHDHYEMADLLESYMKAIVKPGRKKLTTAWRAGLDGILDAYLGELPETFTYEGKTYTPRSFADAMGLDMADYIPVTSFSHHPFYTQFPVEVADNWLWANYYNVPLDELKAIVDNSLEKGYTLVWAADVSEPGFQWSKGYALMPKGKDAADMEGTELSRWVKLSDKDREAERFTITGPCEEIVVTQESRQEGFDNLETTDDHGMIIVGYATDQEGNRYYKVQNSWDTNQLYDGYFYVSEPYLLAKTIDILVHRDAIPAPIRKKLSMK